MLTNNMMYFKCQESASWAVSRRHRVNNIGLAYIEYPVQSAEPQCYTLEFVLPSQHVMNNCSAQEAQNNMGGLSGLTKPVNPEKLTVCEWTGCGTAFGVAEDLYRHVCDEHVGRNSTNNLCLTCHWGRCTASYGKRDHITSHIRIHIPMKPFACQQCGKTFKRSQDLRKHGRTHVTSSESGSASPRATAEVYDDVKEPALDSHSGPKLSPGTLYPRIATSTTSPYAKSPIMSGAYHYPAFSPNTSPLSYSGASHSSPSSSTTPDAHPISPMASSGLLQAWNDPMALRERACHRLPDYFDLDARHSPRVDATPISGVKRSRSTVDEFFDDVQRKRMAPVYNPGMVERLDLLSSTMDDSGDMDGSFSSLTTGFPGTDRNGSLFPPEFNPTRAPRLSFGSSIADINLWLVQLGNSVLRNKPEPLGPEENQPALDHPGFDFSQTLSQYDLNNIPGLEGLGISAGTPALPVHPVPITEAQPGPGNFVSYDNSMGHAPVPHMPGTAPYDAYARGYDVPVYPQLAPADKGVQHSFRRVELLTRAPSEMRSSAAKDRDGEMDIDNDDEKPQASNVDPTRERHIGVIISMLLALNKGKRSAPAGLQERRTATHMYPSLSLPPRPSEAVAMRASRSWQPMMRQMSGDAFRAPESRQMHRHLPHTSYRQPPAESVHNKAASNDRALPSIAELLSDDM